MTQPGEIDARDAHRRTVTLAIIVALGGFLFGLDASVISGVIGFITPEFSLNEWQIGLVVGAPTLAGIASSIGSGLLSDAFGRKRVLIALAALYTISSVSAAIAPNYETLVAARFVGGLAFASLSIAPMYIAEIAPEDKRGLLVSFNQFNIMVGFSAAYFANYFLLNASQDGAAWVQSLGIDRHTWRWMLGLGAVPAAIWLVLLLGIPESPRWLTVKGRLDDARAVLARIRVPAQVDAALREIRISAAEPAGSLWSRSRELLKPAMRLPLAIALIIGITQQVTGINAVYFYAPSIFEQTGVGTNAAFAQATLIGIINLIFTVIAMVLIDRLGRRPLLVIGLVGVIISTALCGYGFNQARYQLTAESLTTLSAEIERTQLAPLVGVEYPDDLAFRAAVGNAVGPEALKKHEAQLIQASIRINPYLVLTGILGFVASFALSLGPVMWVLFSEIFPNRIRGVAMAFAGFFNSLASFAVQFLFPWELTHLGNSWTFCIYSIFGVAGLALLARLLPETRGKTLEQLEADFAAR